MALALASIFTSPASWPWARILEGRENGSCKQFRFLHFVSTWICIGNGPELCIASFMPPSSVSLRNYEWTGFTNFTSGEDCVVMVHGKIKGKHGSDESAELLLTWRHLRPRDLSSD